MGSNVYLVNRCKSCGHEERIHIGKFSAGWKFLWQGGWVDGINVREAIEVVRLIRRRLSSHSGWTLENPGGLGETTLDELMLKIGSFQSGKDHDHNFTCWIDPLGYWVSSAEFS